MTLENGKPIAKIFLYNFPFQKDLLPLFSSELIQKIFLVRPYPFSLLTTKIRLMRPLQEVQDMRQLRPLRNEEDFTQHYNNGNYNGGRLRRLGEFEGSEEFPD